MSSKKRDLDADVDDSEDNATIDAARRMFDAPDEPIPRAGRPMPGVMPRRPASNGLSPSEHMALGGDPARRARIADMKARAERMARRPLPVADGNLGLPAIPDYQGWTYMWGRANLGGKADADRLQALQTGRLRWEYASFDDLDPAVQRLVAEIVYKDGSYQGFVGINDVILMRTSAEARALLADEDQYRADQLIIGTLADNERGLVNMGAERVRQEFDYESAI